MKRTMMGLTAALVGMMSWMMSSAALAESITDQLKLESVHTGKIRLGRAHIPLPDGEWVITSLHEYKNDQKTVLATVVLASFSDQQLAGYIVLDVNADLGSSGWVPHQFCRRSDVYFIQKDIDHQNDQACWGVNHYVFEKTSTYKPTQGKNIQAYMAGRGQPMPGTMIGAIFRFANRSNFLTYQFYTNPVLHGLPDESGKWADSSWHKELVGASPKKVELLESVKAQSAPLYAAMKDGGLYTERTGGASGKPMPALAPPAGAPSIEQRLITLKDLYERQLITPGEYEAKRKEILGGL